jgi:hypothetical protein
MSWFTGKTTPSTVCGELRTKNTEVDTSFEGQQVKIRFSYKGIEYGDQDDTGLSGTIANGEITLDKPIEIKTLKLSDICITEIYKEILPVKEDLKFEEFTSTSVPKKDDNVILIMRFFPDINANKTLQTKLDWLKERNGQNLTISGINGSDISLKDSKSVAMNGFKIRFSTGDDGTGSLFIGVGDLSSISQALKLVKPKLGGGAKKSRRTNKKSKKTKSTKKRT